MADQVIQWIVCCLRSMRVELQALRESLQQAVAEGDGAGLEGAQEHGSAYRTQVRDSGTFGYLDGSLTSGELAKFLRS